MKLAKHIILSLIISIVLFIFTKSVYAGILCFVFGVFMDVDHIIEYILHYGWKDFTLKNVFRACEQTEKREGKLRFKKLYLIFHIGEIAILLLVAAIFLNNIYLWAIAIGYSSHLFFDLIGNNIKPINYLLSWRIMNNFDIK